jgi:putative addiction module component (TIGR02574 family)
MTEERKPMPVEQIVAAALDLSREDRLLVLEQVEDSLYSDEIDPTVLAEAHRRLDEMKSGRVAPVPFEQLLDDLDRLAS